MDTLPAMPPRHADILLHPGEWIVTAGPVVVHTLLGSCVALTFWEPQSRIGGMCHYLLPAPHRPVEQHEDGRYGTTVFARLIRALQREGVDPAQCEIKLFGGGNMLPAVSRDNGQGVGERNIEIARLLLARHQLPLVAEDCGGFGHRTVLFELWSGHVWVRHTDLSNQKHPAGATRDGRHEQGTAAAAHKLAMAQIGKGS
jgi:chemotaxis protein CheD